ncbi:MAG: D-alanyl-D-alanine carboxypeptidase family protein [Lachnospiraceae bacterium]|nr:D-alanyl-D-alanine carboxypeptidase family protein [Lachnospiraceae bacterium]
MKKILGFTLIFCLCLGMLACNNGERADDAENKEETGEISEESKIDYLVLVNKLNPLPDGFEEALETVTITNSVGDEVEVEKKAYEAYEKLKNDLEVNEGIYTELDSARRSVAEQQRIMDEFTLKYGADYAAKTVAQPGYSEHHTGLALDLYFKVKADDGSFIDVYENEDMEKDEYLSIWSKIHEKLATYGFILRYLEGKEHITGYRYEPWHIRYVGSSDIAGEIMSRPGLTFEEYTGGRQMADVTINLGTSALYSREELTDAMLAIKCKFAAFPGCELLSIDYAGDEAVTDENLEWLNTVSQGASYTKIVKFTMDFRTESENTGTLNPDSEYNDYEWWLAKEDGGDWEVVTFGYGHQ